MRCAVGYDLGCVILEPLRSLAVRSQGDRHNPVVRPKVWSSLLRSPSAIHRARERVIGHKVLPDLQTKLPQPISFEENHEDGSVCEENSHTQNRGTENSTNAKTPRASRVVPDGIPTDCELPHTKSAVGHAREVVAVEGDSTVAQKLMIGHKDLQDLQMQLPQQISLEPNNENGSVCEEKSRTKYPVPKNMTNAKTPSVSRGCPAGSQTNSDLPRTPSAIRRARQIGVEREGTVARMRMLGPRVLPDLQMKVPPPILLKPNHEGGSVRDEKPRNANPDIENVTKANTPSAPRVALPVSVQRSQCTGLPMPLGVEPDVIVCGDQGANGGVDTACEDNMTPSPKVQSLRDWQRNAGGPMPPLRDM